MTVLSIRNEKKTNNTTLFSSVLQSTCAIANRKHKKQKNSSIYLQKRKRANMGTGPSAKKHGARSKIKKYKRKTWLCRRAKDTDQIQDEIEKSIETGKPIQFEYDDELPGGGQFYCVETGKHFTDAKALADHKKSRYYKKRCKELKEEKYTQDFAEWAAGMTKEKLPPAHPKK